mmetsp:Transcript_71080/g.203703  ORF Transcript_71080/g.203703 Transcript_71080/m.203703 type:complete len:208 (+) Transcript_71080:1255-1878(+)
MNKAATLLVAHRQHLGTRLRAREQEQQHGGLLELDCDDRRRGPQRILQQWIGTVLQQDLDGIDLPFGDSPEERRLVVPSKAVDLHALGECLSHDVYVAQQCGPMQSRGAVLVTIVPAVCVAQGVYHVVELQMPEEGVGPLRRAILVVAQSAVPLLEDPSRPGACELVALLVGLWIPSGTRPVRGLIILQQRFAFAIVGHCGPIAGSV